MGRVTALFAEKVVAAASDALDRAELRRSVGLASDRREDVAESVDAEAYYALFERVAAADGPNDAAPLRVGGTMRCDEYGAFGLGWKTAPTLRDSFRRGARYARLLTNVATYEVRAEADAVAYVARRVGSARRGRLLSIEATLASIHTIAREVAGPTLSPTAVRFEHAPLRDPAAYERWFGAPVGFDARETAYIVSDEDADRPNRLGDAGLAAFFDAELDRALRERRAAETIAEQVADEALRTLCSGPPRMAEVARRLGVSERTLQRRLADEGSSFQEVLDTTRRSAAEALLRSGRHSLADVAFLTGFSEQSAFTRAAKRWFGQPPGALRGHV